jgi:hypothetical protein
MIFAVRSPSGSVARRVPRQLRTRPVILLHRASSWRIGICNPLTCARKFFLPTSQSRGCTDCRAPQNRSTHFWIKAYSESRRRDCGSRQRDWPMNLAARENANLQEQPQASLPAASGAATPVIAKGEVLALAFGAGELCEPGYPVGAGSGSYGTRVAALQRCSSP